MHALERLELAPGEDRERDAQVRGQAGAPLHQACVGDLLFFVDTEDIDDVALVDVLAQRPFESGPGVQPRVALGGGLSERGAGVPHG